jgi:hypothetical protein
VPSAMTNTTTRAMTIQIQVDTAQSWQTSDPRKTQPPSKIRSTTLRARRVALR